MLSEKQLLQIKELQEICERHDQIKLKLNWDMLRNRNNDVNEDLFFFDDNKLVGFLGMYCFGEKVEICGMVHPDYRRKGIFTKLLAEALNNCNSMTTILLNAPAASKTAKAFIDQQTRFGYSFSEYQMAWKGKEIPTFEETVKLEKAKPEDFELITRLDVECFGFEAKDAGQYNHRILNEPNRTMYLVVVNDDKIGKLSVQREKNESWIFGFAISPTHQSKGYGKNTLLQIIKKENQIGNEIHLEVALENNNAKKLYTDSGFEQYDTQDYYKFS